MDKPDIEEADSESRTLQNKPASWNGNATYDCVDMVFISKSNIQWSQEAIVLLSSQLSLGSMRTSLLVPERRLSSSHGGLPPSMDQSVSYNVSSHLSVKNVFIRFISNVNFRIVLGGQDVEPLKRLRCFNYLPCNMENHSFLNSRKIKLQTYFTNTL